MRTTGSSRPYTHSLPLSSPPTPTIPTQPLTWQRFHDNQSLQQGLSAALPNAKKMSHYDSTFSPIPLGLNKFLVWDEIVRFRVRSEEHTSELQSLLRISYAVFCLNKNKYSSISNTQNRYHTLI